MKVETISVIIKKTAATCVKNVYHSKGTEYLRYILFFPFPLKVNSFLVSVIIFDYCYE